MDKNEAAIERRLFEGCTALQEIIVIILQMASAMGDRK